LDLTVSGDVNLLGRRIGGSEPGGFAPEAALVGNPKDRQ